MLRRWLGRRAKHGIGPVEQLLYRPVVRVPHEERRVQGDGQVVVGRPVEGVEVEVVAQLGGVEDLLGPGGHVAGLGGALGFGLAGGVQDLIEKRND